MQDIILAGSGGCMRELVWQIQELNKVIPTWNVLGYVDCSEPENGQCVYVGNIGIPYLGTDDVLLERDEDTNVTVCVGNPKLRKKIATKLMKNDRLKFPNIILSNTYICEDIKIGQGCIVSMDARISTNVQIGDFVFLNTGSMVCHDGILGDFITLSPDVKLAGAVTVGSESEIGMGAKVIQGVTVAQSVFIGAGAVVIRDIAHACTAVGVPAKPIK